MSQVAFPVRPNPHPTPTQFKLHPPTNTFSSFLLSYFFIFIHFTLVLGRPQALLSLIAAAPDVQLLELMKHPEFAEQPRRRTAAPGQTKTTTGGWADLISA